MVSLYGLALLAALASRVTAQDHSSSSEEPTPTESDSESSSTPSATTTSSSGPATVTIEVGAHGHVFTPKQAKANVGDIIRFNFYPGAHRVARAAFGWPCIPIEYTDSGKKGFYSGIISPQVVSNDPPNFQVRVNDTEPIFFYCAAPGSCVDYHMIGVINPNATHTYDAQLIAAERAQYQLEPGEPFPSETSLPRPPGAGGSGDEGGSSLSAGAIAGIAIGGAAVLILAGALIYLCGRRGGFDKAYRKSVPAPAPAPDMLEAASHANPKSPGQATLSTFSGNDATLRNSTVGAHPQPFFGHSPSPNPPPHAGQLPGYGTYVPGQTAYDPHGYASPHSSPKPEQYAPFVPPPVELPTQDDAPVPTRSPPPGYNHGRESWAPGQEGQYRPGGKP